MVVDEALADRVVQLELARVEAQAPEDPVPVELVPHEAQAPADPVVELELVPDEARAPADPVPELVVAEEPQQRWARRTKPVRRVKRM